MKIKNYTKRILLSCSAAIVLLAAGARAGDATGAWTWTSPGRNGGPERVSTLTLKVEDSKLTGKISVPGPGGQALENTISDGKVEGDKISFNLVRSYNGNSNTNKYSGSISADKITGKIESVNRNGELQSRDWGAKRVAGGK